MTMIARLLAAIALATGIVRVNDPYLAQVAASRIPALEHHWANPLSIPAMAGWGWGEVAGRNIGAPDPVEWVVEGWMASAEHRRILLGRQYMRIGCATSTAGWTYLVCILGTPVIPALPNTATRARA